MMRDVHDTSALSRKSIIKIEKQKILYPNELDKGRFKRGSTLYSQITHMICLCTLLETYTINARAREHLLLFDA